MMAAGRATVVGVVPARVAALTEGVLKAMLLSKLKTATVGLLLVALLLGAAGAIYPTQAAVQPKGEHTNKTTTDVPTAKPGPQKGHAPKHHLDGVWAVVSVVDKDKNKLDSDPIFSYAAGTQAPIRNARLTLRKGGFALKTGLVSLNGWYVFDSSTTPKEISLNLNPYGDDALISLRGVYALDGDNLTISLSEVPASQVAGLAGRPPGVCYTLRREASPKAEQRNKTTTDVSTSEVVPHPPRVAAQREYAIVSRVLEATADQPKETLRLPRVTIEEGQRIPIHLADGPQNLLDKVVLDENIKIGTIFDVRVKRLGGKTVRLFLSFQRNEIDKSSVSEIGVLGNTLQAIKDVELHKPVKMVFQKDARGSAQRWVEITVDELTVDERPVPAPAVSAPQQKGDRR
jgi:hypothetical protein